MSRVPITVMGFRCDRCGHEWVPRDFSSMPKACPKCKSPNWNLPKGEPVLTYEEFRDRVNQALLSAGDPLSWTEVRTVAGLPQLFPNNQWVHRMETDIGLQRKKDEKGIIRWELGHAGD